MPLDTRGVREGTGAHPFEANPFHFVHGHTNASFLGPRRTHPLVKPSPAQPNVWWVWLPAGIAGLTGLEEEAGEAAAWKWAGRDSPL